MPNLIDPITRTESYLNKMAGGSGRVPDEPITRKEMYLAKAIGQSVTAPEPITREEMYLDAIANSGGGGGGGESATLITKTITENGTYNASADSAYGYSKVTVNVPVGITPSGNLTLTDNQANVDCSSYASVTVAIPTASGVSF